MGNAVQAAQKAVRKAIESTYAKVMSDFHGKNGKVQMERLCMNKNIEVIMPELWATHSEWIKAGYIQELKPISEENISQLMLTNKGVLVLDKSSKLYPALKKLFPVVQKMEQEKLERIIEQNPNMENLDPLSDLWVNVVGWEMKRREVKQAYLIDNSKQTLKSRINNFWRKRKKKGR